MELKEVVLRLAKECEIVFDLTGRSVPSNHSEKLNVAKANVKTLIKELEASNGPATTSGTDASAGTV